MLMTGPQPSIAVKFFKDLDNTYQQKQFEVKAYHKDKQLNIELNGTRLEQVDSVKLLGLEIDEEISFDNHTHSLTKKYLEEQPRATPAS